MNVKQGKKELQDLLRKHNLPTSGTKETLMKRLLNVVVHDVSTQQVGIADKNQSPEVQQDAVTSPGQSFFDATTTMIGNNHQVTEITSACAGTAPFCNTAVTSTPRTTQSENFPRVSEGPMTIAGMQYVRNANVGLCDGHTMEWKFSTDGEQ